MFFVVDKWFRPEILHKGSRDSFEKIKFHSNVNGKHPYVFLIKSEKSIFGGYTDLKIPNLN
jgi:hypothetical protein